MLTDVIDAYLRPQRSLGMRFESAGRLLRRFGRAMGNPTDRGGHGRERPRLPQGIGPLTATWMLKHRVLTGFYRFAVSRGYVDSSPLPTTLPKLPPQQTPYVYSTDELRRLLDATATLHVATAVKRDVPHAAVAAVRNRHAYRRGIRLTLQDVDLAERIITVRYTKFFKTRLVPIGPKLRRELAAHIERRRPSAARRRGCAAIHHAHGQEVVLSACHRAVPARATSCRYQLPCRRTRPPRLHDLRHTAAVHRVVAWYRTGQDVQRLLPQLATYLGHLDIRSTQRYLQMTPELLQAASQRFARYAQWGNHHE